MADLVVWRKPPPLVSKSLYNKATKLSLKEALWVWDDVIGMVVTLALFVLASLWLALPYTMQGWARALLVCSLLAWMGCATIFLRRMFSTATDPLKFNYTKGAPLSHSARKQLCLLDRNRKRAPGWERSWRMPDIEHSQYSVWITPDISEYEVWNEVDQTQEHQRGLKFRIVEHRPIRYGWGPRWALQCTATRYIKPAQEGKAAQRIAMSAQTFEATPTFERACEIQSVLEEAAEMLEAHGYDKKVQVHEMERMALQLRR